MKFVETAFYIYMMIVKKNVLWRQNHEAEFSMTGKECSFRNNIYEAVFM